MFKWIKVNDNEIDFRTDNKFIPKSTLYASIDAVNKIVRDYPPPYNLMVSGGIDSQAMLYSWKLSNQPFQATSFVYNDNMNEHDLESLKEFSNKENIKINYLPFDFFLFLENDYDNLANKFKCSSPMITAYIKMSQLAGGTTIFSGNFLFKKGAILSSAILGLYRYSLTEQGKNVIPYFFLYTPELAYSMRNYDQSNEHTNEGKIQLYKQAHFPIIPQKQKYSGFEKYKDYFDDHRKDVYKNREIRMKYANKPSQRIFDWIYRYPYEEKFNDPELKFILNP